MSADAATYILFVSQYVRHDRLARGARSTHDQVFKLKVTSGSHVAVMMKLGAANEWEGCRVVSQTQNRSHNRICKGRNSITLKRLSHSGSPTYIHSLPSQCTIKNHISSFLRNIPCCVNQPKALSTNESCEKSNLAILLHLLRGEASGCQIIVHSSANKGCAECFMDDPYTCQHEHNFVIDIFRKKRSNADPF